VKALPRQLKKKKLKSSVDQEGYLQYPLPDLGDGN